MRTHNMKSILNSAARVIGLLLFGAIASFAQTTTVGLSAGPSTATLPDGTQVPMWGYTCATVNASCAPLVNPAPAAGVWSPVVITVPTGQNLQINLTNNLTFAGGNIPTSIVIVGQLAGGLGTPGGSTASPDHSGAQSATTWPIAGGAGSPINPPVQADRVRSFSTEIAGGGGSGSLTWTAPQPGRTRQRW